MTDGLYTLASGLAIEVALADRADWPVTGSDIVIAELKGPVVLSHEDLMCWAAEFGEQMAGIVHRRLHHGRFAFTSEPDTVRQWARLEEHPECPQCVSGLELALNMLAENPDTTVIVGQLYLCRGPEGA